jgi:hypothetical protein
MSFPPSKIVIHPQAMPVRIEKLLPLRARNVQGSKLEIPGPDLIAYDGNNKIE